MEEGLNVFLLLCLMKVLSSHPNNAPSSFSLCFSLLFIGSRLLLSHITHVSVRNTLDDEKKRGRMTGFKSRNLS